MSSPATPRLEESAPEFALSNGADDADLVWNRERTIAVRVVVDVVSASRTAYTVALYARDSVDASVVNMQGVYHFACLNNDVRMGQLAGLTMDQHKDKHKLPVRVWMVMMTRRFDCDALVHAPASITTTVQLCRKVAPTTVQTIASKTHTRSGREVRDQKAVVRRGDLSGPVGDHAHANDA
jgi:hypothetical protein